MLVTLRRSRRTSAGSVAQLASGELDKEILEIGRPVQVAHAVLPGELRRAAAPRRAHSRTRSRRPAPGAAPALCRAFAAQARASSPYTSITSGSTCAAISARGVSRGDHPSVIDHRQARAKALRLIHEMRREQNGLTLRQQLPQARPRSDAAPADRGPWWARRG